MLYIADGFRYANIPSLALSERAPYGFVRYVHPYPRSHRGANNVRLPTLAESKAKVHSAGGFNSYVGLHQKIKTEGTKMVSSEFLWWSRRELNPCPKTNPHNFLRRQSIY